jgi:predicted SAM-dependent methyltransferase
MRQELLIGCGRRRDKLMYDQSSPELSQWQGLVTLDINRDHNPDVIHDLTTLRYPFSDNEFDEIHAYEVLEHTGAQGDYKFFFAQWSEFWRIMKPNALFFATVPSWKSKWAWGDPSHTRVVQGESLSFLSQAVYERDIGNTSMSDFRYMYKADFDVIGLVENEDTCRFALRAIKPSRLT